MQRFTNILTRHFKIKNLFFLRIKQPQDSDYYEMTKELHFNQIHTPHGNENQEHYCRRWMSIRVLEEIEIKRKAGVYKHQEINIQRSRFHGVENEYLVISIGRTMVSQEHTNYSVAIGFSLNKELKKSIRFWEDPAIPSDVVNVTCERCPIKDCKERVAQPTQLRKAEKNKLIQHAIESLVARTKKP